MAERLCKEPKNIGIYTIPSFTEIQSYVCISSQVPQEKKNKEVIPAANDDSEDDDAIYEDESRGLVEYAIAVIDKHGKLVKPAYVKYHLSLRHDKDEVT